MFQAVMGINFLIMALFFIWEKNHKKIGRTNFDAVYFTLTLKRTVL